jgi:hypothetical protein
MGFCRPQALKDRGLAERHLANGVPLPVVRITALIYMINIIPRVWRMKSKAAGDALGVSFFYSLSKADFTAAFQSGVQVV